MQGYQIALHGWQIIVKIACKLLRLELLFTIFGFIECNRTISFKRDTFLVRNIKS